MRINKEWLKSHLMLKKPSEEQRISWHLEHAKYCACRPIPPNLWRESQRRTLGKD